MEVANTEVGRQAGVRLLLNVLVKVSDGVGVGFRPFATMLLGYKQKCGQ